MYLLEQRPSNTGKGEVTPLNLNGELTINITIIQFFGICFVKLYLYDTT